MPSKWWVKCKYTAFIENQLHAEERKQFHLYLYSEKQIGLKLINYQEMNLQLSLQQKLEFVQ